MPPPVEESQQLLAAQSTDAPNLADVRAEIAANAGASAEDSAAEPAAPPPPAPPSPSSAESGDGAPAATAPVAAVGSSPPSPAAAAAPAAPSASAGAEGASAPAAAPAAAEGEAVGAPRASEADAEAPAASGAGADGAPEPDDPSGPRHPLAEYSELQKLCFTVLFALLVVPVGAVAYSSKEHFVLFFVLYVLCMLCTGGNEGLQFGLFLYAYALALAGWVLLFAMSVALAMPWAACGACVWLSAALHAANRLQRAPLEETGRRARARAACALVLVLAHAPLALLLASAADAMPLHTPPLDPVSVLNPFGAHAPPAQRVGVRVLTLDLATRCVAACVKLAGVALAALRAEPAPSRTRQLCHGWELCVGLARTALPVLLWLGWFGAGLVRVAAAARGAEGVAAQDASAMIGGGFWSVWLLLTYCAFKLLSALEQLHALRRWRQQALLDGARAHEPPWRDASPEELAELGGSEAQCSICHDALSAPVVLPACGHVFCKACLATWVERDRRQRFARDSTCPLCRAKITGVAGGHEVSGLFCFSSQGDGLTDLMLLVC